MRLLYVASESALKVAGKPYTTKPAALFLLKLRGKFTQLVIAAPQVEAPSQVARRATLISGPRVRFVALPGAGGLLRFALRFPLAWLQLLYTAFFETRHVDVVWLRYPGGHVFPFYLAAKLQGKLVVVDYASDVSLAWRMQRGGLFKTLLARLGAWYLTWAGRRLASGAVVFARGEPLLRKFGRNAASACQLYIPTFGRADLHPPLPSPPGRPFRLLYVGQLRFEKGLGELLEAVAALRDKGYDLELLLAGKGPHRKRLEALATRLKLKNCARFLGFIKHGAPLWRLYRAADALVVPSSTYPEGTPRVLLEAWSQGLPVVATRVGGVPYLSREGRDALLVTPGSPGALARALERLVASPDLCRRLAEEGFRRAQALNHDSQGELVERVLNKALRWTRRSAGNPEVFRARPVQQEGL